MKIIFQNALIAEFNTKTSSRGTYSKGFSKAYAASQGLDGNNSKTVNIALEKITRKIGFDSLKLAKDKIVSGPRLRGLRDDLEKQINDAIREIQPMMAALILGQGTGGLMEGGMGGFVPAYSQLSERYWLHKRAVASGKHKLTQRGGVPNYLAGNPIFAQRDRHYMHSGRLVTYLKRTAGLLPKRIGEAKVTFNESLMKEKNRAGSEKKRGTRVGDFDAETYRDIIGSFEIQYFGRLSFYEYSKIMGNVSKHQRDDSLPYSLYPKQMAARLKGTDKAPGRPLLLPTLAFFAQTRIPGIIQKFVGESRGAHGARRPGRAQTRLYARAQPNRKGA